MIFKRLEVQSKLIKDTTNCYIIEDNGEMMCVDPGGDLNKIIEMIRILNGKLKYIYLTHSHCDHTQCAQALKQNFGGDILISRKGEENVNKSSVNMSMLISDDINILIDSRVDNDDIIHVGDVQFRVIDTPGHTNDSTSLYCEKEKFVITGDTLMAGCYGRTDLPTGSESDIKKSLEKIFKLPDNTIVYPGHGESTIIFEEKEKIQ